MVESELGLIPQGWEVKQLGEMCHVIMGLSPKSEFYNETGEGLSFHQGVTDFGERFPTDRVYCTVQKRVAEADDILFSVRAPVGRINIANKKIVIGRGLSAIRSKNGNQAFLLQTIERQIPRGRYDGKWCHLQCNQEDRSIGDSTTNPHRISNWQV